MLHAIKTANEVTFYCAFYVGTGLNIQLSKLNIILYRRKDHNP